MPLSSLPKIDRIRRLNKQFDEFLFSQASRKLMKILSGEELSKNNTWDKFSKVYDTRKGGERQEAVAGDTLKNLLEENRQELYDIFYELGFLSINTPRFDNPNHILILGASHNASYKRTFAVKKLIEHNEISTAELKDISALTTYRIISPAERKASCFTSEKETEFGVLCDSFSTLFDCTEYTDEFNSSRNTNIISCIRKYSSDKIKYQVYAAPSSQLDSRANSDDTYRFYFEKNFENNEVASQDRHLLITNNVYCNYQFIPFAMQILSNDWLIDFDIIGCSDDKDITLVSEYDPNRYLQDFISILDWIKKFKAAFDEYL